MLSNSFSYLRYEGFGVGMAVFPEGLPDALAVLQARAVLHEVRLSDLVADRSEEINERLENRTRERKKCRGKSGNGSRS